MYNENVHHKNGHTLYLAETGHGKSTLMKKKSGIPASGVRVVLFDPNRDHKAHRYKTRAGFARALRAAHLSGRGFRIAYTGETTAEAFEWVCKAVRAILDGSKTTYFIAEEYGSVSTGAGPILPKNYPAHFALWTQGRKFGLSIHAASQRPQNISKDALENAGRIYAGGMGSRAAKSVNNETDIPLEDIKALPVGTFIEWQRVQEHRRVVLF
jgi:hypothetical protein